MCACEPGFVCAADRPRHQTDIALTVGDDTPPTPEEERRHELTSLETLRGLSE